MLEAIVRAPILFFERNSVGTDIWSVIGSNYGFLKVLFYYLGRILNRFTKDLGCMDDQLPQFYLDMIVVGSFC